MEAGGLISYGPNMREMFRRAATCVDRIFKGANPGDIPIVEFGRGRPVTIEFGPTSIRTRSVDRIQIMTPDSE